MVLVCSKCDARLKLDEARLPSHSFSVRCPKCQAAVEVPAPAAPEVPVTPEPVAPSGPFERPVAAPRFGSANSSAGENSVNQTVPAAMEGVIEMLAQALRQSDGSASGVRGRRRWDKRKVLVCASAAYRDAIAQSLSDSEYDVFVAQNMAEGLGRMREERMDVVVLDSNFDPLEQGVAFINREVRLLRPSERRRLFLVSLTSGVRSMDPHAAFLQNVNLVMNPSDLEQLSEALDISIRHYNELYRDFNRALDLTPI